MQIKFPSMKLHFSKLFYKLVIGFPYFFSAFLCLLLTHIHLLCLICRSWGWPMDFGWLAKFRSAQEHSRGQCRQHPTWNSLHCVPFPHQSPDPKQQHSPWLCRDSQLLFLLKQSSEKEKVSFTSCQVFYCYCIIQVTRWRDFFPSFKGLLLLTLHWL